MVAATAYHWIGPESQLDRPAELLDKGGIIGIVDLIQVNTDQDRGFFHAAQPIYEWYGVGHRGPPAPSRNARVTAPHEPAVRVRGGQSQC